MISAAERTIAAPSAIPSWENEGGGLAVPGRPSPRKTRLGKRPEDTVAGCRANAAANLQRALAPGADYMRLRLEHSATVWSERADLLERLERKTLLRAPAA